MTGPAGFVPVDVDLAVPDAPVTWVEATNLRLAHPFFDQSVRHLLESVDNVRRFSGSLEALLGPGEAVAAFAPTAFIFHVSRCGSSALVNALQQIKHGVVAAEPPAISGLLALHDWSAEEVRLESCLRALVWRLGALRRSPAAPFFVKLISWAALRIGLFAKLWPHTPWIFVTRSPAEVVVAQLENRNAARGWLSWRHAEAQVRALTGWEPAWISQASDAEYCARMVGDLLRCAADRREGRILLHYPEIDADGVERLLGRLELSPGAAESHAIRQSLRLHSKEPGRTPFFIPDDRIKQGRVTAEIRSACRRWADPTYEALLAESPPAP
jgi:hypothetical protein